MGVEAYIAANIGNAPAVWWRHHSLLDTTGDSGITIAATIPSSQGEGAITKRLPSLKVGKTPLLPWDYATKEFVEGGIYNFAISGSADLGTSCEADAFTVGGTSGTDFDGAVTNITVVKGIITAAS